MSTGYPTALVGSFPHADDSGLCERIVRQIDVPTWPQLPRRCFRENMYVQFSARLPGIRLDEINEKIIFDTSQDLTPDLEIFYTHYLEEDLDYFALTREYAIGFDGLLSQLRAHPSQWAKGQVTGPISFGLIGKDQNMRSALYNEELADAIVKNVATCARWQIRQFHTVCPNVILSVDEPYMASFGSAYISLSADQVVSMLGEVFSAIHAENALACVHCCGNTDWSVLMGTNVDILSLDAYGYVENLALYPSELRNFLDRNGGIAWGIVPNDEEIKLFTPQGIADRLHQGMETIQEKAKGRGYRITIDDLAARSIVTPQCGLGSTSVEIAERVFDVLVETGEILRRG